MKSQIRPAIVSLILLTILTGAVYPAVVTLVAKVVFPHQADGSLIIRDGKAVGSELIGQSFSDPKYFWGRLSATSPVPYTAFNADAGTSASGSNYGPSNPALIDAAKARIDALKAADPTNMAPIPVDLVTASASGLDPHISPAAAQYQAARVARARNMSLADIQKMIDRHTENRTFGVLGEPRVNVLQLNLALDRAQPR